MTEIETDKLVPTSTDMLVGMLGNTEKMLSSNKRVNYAEHRGEYADDDDKLDVDTNAFIKNKKDGNIFKRNTNDHDRTKNNSEKHNNGNMNGADHGINPNNGTAHRANQTSGMADKKKDHDTDTETQTDTNRDGDEKVHSKKEMMLLKLDMLRKLGELKQLGVHLSQNYNLDSDLEMMQYEYKLHHDIRSKKNSVQWMSHMMIGIVKGTEMLNDGYNPFDIKLAGLSNIISSDMHNYYAVLGDIYEKYNQPGKQMAPEMRLLLMISGAALSMQINRIAPEGIKNMMGVGGMANNIKNDDQTLNELRKKAEADSTNRPTGTGAGTGDVDEKVREYVKKQHDLATQKVADLKMLQEKEREIEKMNRMMNGQNSNMKNFKEKLMLSSEQPSEKDNNNGLTQDEIEHIKKMRYMEEQKHLEMLRNVAQQKSDMFRSAGKKDEKKDDKKDDKKKQDLDRQNKQLDNILNSINHTDPVKNSKKQTDDQSVASNASSISVNPKIGNIMKRTSEKAHDEHMKNMKNLFDTKNNSDKPKSKNSPDLSKFDKTINNLLEDNVSDLDNLSKEDISIGSLDKKKNTKKNPEKKTNDLVDFGMISFGSKNKGNKPSFNVGKTAK
jgi:hypothetical protein